jgi:predicted phosphoribosyltransferase
MENIIVDDGGQTPNAKHCDAAKKNPAKIIVAVPVLPYDSLKNSSEYR